MLGRVTAETLNIRSFPGSTGKIIGTLGKNSLLDIKGQSGGWYRFDYNNSSAYVFGRYIDKVNNIRASKGRVSTDKLNIRSQPSLASSIMGVLSRGSVINIIDEHGEWLEIRFDNQPAYINKNYIEQIASDIQSKGRVNTPLLNVRNQPSADANRVGQLSQDVIVDIVGEVDNWYEIKYDGTTAFVSAKYIQLVESGTAGRYFFQKARLRELDMKPASQLAIPSDKEGRRTAHTWNEYGHLIAEISDTVGIDVGCAIAVLCVESSGKGFSAANGDRMIIRFENHHFWRRWGKFNQDVFSLHFKFDEDRAWTGHRFRLQETDEWSSFHGKQEKEWQVLEYARSLDDTAALKSISMGAPQVMGFNHQKIGYQTVQQMFNNLSSNMRYHIFALFDFLDNRMISALREHDFARFAGYYNGPGQAEEYGSWIQEHYEAFSKFNV